MLTMRNCGHDFSVSTFVRQQLFSHTNDNIVLVINTPFVDHSYCKLMTRHKSIFHLRFMERNVPVQFMLRLLGSGDACILNPEKQTERKTFKIHKDSSIVLVDLL